jgi:hypothetical protein
VARVSEVGSSRAVRPFKMYCNPARNVNAAPTVYFVSCCRYHTPGGKLHNYRFTGNNRIFVTRSVGLIRYYAYILTSALVLPLFVPLRHDFAEHVVHAPLVLFAAAAVTSGRALAWVMAGAAAADGTLSIASDKMAGRVAVMLPLFVPL